MKDGVIESMEEYERLLDDGKMSIRVDVRELNALSTRLARIESENRALKEEKQVRHDGYSGFRIERYAGAPYMIITFCAKEFEMILDPDGNECEYFTRILRSAFESFLEEYAHNYTERNQAKKAARHGRER